MELKIFTTVFVTVFLAELGDKTQLATLLYAADAKNPKWMVFLGAAAALILTTAIGVMIGAAVSRYLSPRYLSWGAGTGFILIGMWTIWRA